MPGKGPGGGRIEKTRLEPGWNLQLQLLGYKPGSGKKLLPHPGFQPVVDNMVNDGAGSGEKNRPKEGMKKKKLCP